jgi:hypothetical protein
MPTVSESVEQAINQAQNSGNTSEAQVPAAQQAADVPAAGAPSMDALVSGAMIVDGYIKVDEYGIHFDGEKKNKKDNVLVDIDTTEVQPTEVVRFGNNPPTYYKTYDGVNCAQGGTWQQALQTARAADPQCRPYTSADIPMTLVEDHGDDYEAGTRLGHSLSPTNQANFAKFWRDVQSRGLQGQTIRVKLGWQEKKKNGNEWGVLTFELVETEQ